MFSMKRSRKRATKKHAPIEENQKTSKQRRQKRRRNDEKSIQIAIWIVALVVIFLFIILIIPKEQRKKRIVAQTKQQPDIQKAKLMASEGLKLLKNRNFVKAEKVLKESKKILYEGLSYYKKDSRKHKKVQSLLRKVLERYHMAYKHSTIK